MAYSWWELDGNTCSVVRQAGSITTEQTVQDGKQRILRSRAGFSNRRSGKGLKQRIVLSKPSRLPGEQREQNKSLQQGNIQDTNAESTCRQQV
ncbi:unnamed protein product [Staurois parvus]|uniref:Uncharacterized protein n=1 Tax=Staurois parvus TaxID=386267 RepID=A0ABN9GBT7_9NEOB|nr:unnamed protein product [Staurois parvus]